ncbi:MAG: DNA-binding response regulator [Proteobacteria bacterium]|nr:DNA-binding response regulator [Pseudomonadota bacterium]
MKEKILVVDDEESMVDVIRYSLEKAGYLVCSASDGEEALRVAREEKPNLVVLDLMLPRLDGYEVCKIMCVEFGMPIIMLTAKDDEVDKVVGLEVGADDYLTKPFSPRELVARVRAHLRRDKRRAPQEAPNEMRFGELSINFDRREVHLGPRRIDLTPREFDVLSHLSQNANKVVTRESLLDKVWGYDYYGEDRIVNVTIARLREKIETDAAHPRYVTTVRGAGYLFQKPDDTPRS